MAPLVAKREVFFWRFSLTKPPVLLGVDKKALAYGRRNIDKYINNAVEEGRLIKAKKEPSLSGGGFFLSEKTCFIISYFDFFYFSDYIKKDSHIL